MTYRLWDPAEPLKITHPAEVSLRDKETPVFPPKAGYVPFPDPGRIIYQPCFTEKNDEEGNEDDDGVRTAPQAQQ